MKVYLHAFSVLASFLLVYVWKNTELWKYSLPAIGFFIFIFLLISMRSSRKFNLGGPLNFFLLNTVLLIFILTTGGITSNLFFLLYFLLFAASFIMSPKSVFVFPICVIIIFWAQIFQGDVTANLIKIGSIVLLSPLAYLFGKEFKQNRRDEDEILKAKERAVSSADEISKDAKQILESANDKLSPQEKSKLKEVLNESQSLREEK